MGMCAGLGGLAGCEGAGSGQVSGTLFLRGCPAQDPTPAGSTEVPSPLPAFSLNPQYFFGEVQQAPQSEVFSDDPRGVTNMEIRLQRNSGDVDMADVFTLLIYDVANYPQLQAAAIQSGSPGAPIIPPDLSSTTAPLPGDPSMSVAASISLNLTCAFPSVAPLLSGYVNFSMLGQNLGDTVAGQFSVTVEDARAIREQGNPPSSPDTAGAFTGWFNFPLRAGPLYSGL
jgi:hypothetical protein